MSEESFLTGIQDQTTGRKITWKILLQWIPIATYLTIRTLKNLAICFLVIHWIKFIFFWFFLKVYFVQDINAGLKDVAEIPEKQVSTLFGFKFSPYITCCNLSYDYKDTEKLNCLVFIGVTFFFLKKVPLSSLSIEELQNLIIKLKKASNGELNTKY